MGGRLYLENCCRQDTCSVLLQKPKLSTEVYEITGGAGFQLNRRTFYQLDLSKNGLLMLWPAAHPWKYSAKATSWQRKLEAGDFY